MLKRSCRRETHFSPEETALLIDVVDQASRRLGNADDETKVVIARSRACSRGGGNARLRYILSITRRDLPEGESHAA
jgi:hypothetical protein